MKKLPITKSFWKSLIKKIKYMENKKDLYEGLGCMFILIGIAILAVALSVNWDKVFN